MKKLILFSIIILFSNSFLKAQLLNQKLTNDKTGEVILIGQCTIDAFQKDNFEKWFRQEYGSYKYNLKKRYLDSIKPIMQETEILIVLGTWCSDSKEHFPALMTVIDYLQYPNDKYKIIAVDRNKNAAIVPTDYLNIVKVPTFIVYKNGKELGRIIETPIETIEEDLLNIFRGRYTQK